MRKITEIVIHHTAVSNTVQPDPLKQISSMAKTHEARFNNPDINGSHTQYHYVTDYKGATHPTRDHESPGRHASNLEVNYESIAICLT